MAIGDAERQYLDAGLQTLRPSLESRGFRQEPGAQPSPSSGRSFATVRFRRSPLEIGLIVRTRNELGSPNYYCDGLVAVGHNDLMWALGAEATAHLSPGELFAYHARAGGDPFEALRLDLEQVVLPALDRSAQLFRQSLDQARRRLQARRGW